jgi:hypothetical protein
MKGCFKMTYLSYEDKMKLLASVFDEKVKKLDSLSEEEARIEARKELIRIGYLDNDGNLAAPYVALRNQYV